MKKISVIFIIFLLYISAIIIAKDREHCIQTRFFEDIKVVSLKTLSGSCTVNRTSLEEIKVEVDYYLGKNETLEPQFEESGDTLKMLEFIDDFHSGGSQWKLDIPEGIEMIFKSNSGSLKLSKINNGRFSAGVNSGDIIVEECAGIFDMVANSGNVRAEDVIIQEASIFASNSGTAHVVLAESPEYDLVVGSNAKALLDYADNELKGKFEFSFEKGNSRIFSPKDFEKVEEFEKGGKKYLRKWFTVNADIPVIKIGTSGGKLIFKK